MSHVYKQVAKVEKVPTVREMVTLYGDDWRKLVMHQNGYPFREQFTFDEMEATALRFMEEGKWPRIKTQDLPSLDD